MVVKEDGSKWACQSCLKGHRVSGCTHTDRELTLVPKKGRPVTQCQHCRLERKKRSAHVKCDCGETDKPHHPKEKCIHLREAEERAKAGYYDDHPYDKDPSHLAAVAEEQGCCCHHGGRCTCAVLKREDSDDVLAPHGPAVKPRLEKTTSDGAITVFTNGHHKPVHRKNHAAHECGMPYKMPMQRSSTDQNMTANAWRSSDSLPLDADMSSQGPAFADHNGAPFNLERRKSKSEQHSPKIPPTSMGCHGMGDPRFNSIDFSSLAQTQTNSSMQSSISDNFFPPLEPMSGLTDGSIDPWSAYQSADSSNMPNNNPFGVWPTSYDGSGLAQPALTAASSGTHSEIDELPLMDDFHSYPMPSIQEDSDSINLVNINGSNSPQANRRSLPPGFFGNTDFNLSTDNTDWSPMFGNVGSPNDNKSQNTPPAMENYWSSMPHILSVPQRALGGFQGGSRPQSRSVGSTSAPNDDVIRQLFPDIDVNGSMFGSTDSPRMNMGAEKGMNGLPVSSGTSAPMEFGPMDTGFTSQQWTDGSMTVTNDTFPNSYELDQDYSNPDFSGNWAQ